MMLLLVAISFGTAATFVVLSIPAECWQTIRRNSRRLDGSLSRRRFRREFTAIQGYATTLLIPVLLVSLTMMVLLFGTFTYLMPWSLTDDAVIAVVTGSDDDLQTVRRRHESIFRDRGHSNEMIVSIQTFLAKGWPLVALMIVGCIATGAWFFMQVARREVIRLVRGVKDRRGLYARQDVSHLLVGQAVHDMSDRNSVRSG